MYKLKSACNYLYNIFGTSNRLEEYKLILTRALDMGFASHGDFTNRKLKLTNLEILADNAFRAEQQISYEAYDDAIMQAYGIHVSDKPFPQNFSPQPPQTLIEQEQSFLLLTHPRWWRRDISSNLIETLRRIWEQLRW